MEEEKKDFTAELQTILWGRRGVSVFSTPAMVEIRRRY
jgi:hypothetical protein